MVARQPGHRSQGNPRGLYRVFKPPPQGWTEAKAPISGIPRCSADLWRHSDLKHPHSPNLHAPLRAAGGTPLLCTDTASPGRAPGRGTLPLPHRRRARHPAVHSGSCSSPSPPHPLPPTTPTSPLGRDYSSQHALAQPAAAGHAGSRSPAAPPAPPPARVETPCGPAPRSFGQPPFCEQVAGE